MEFWKFRRYQDASTDRNCVEMVVLAATIHVFVTKNIMSQWCLFYQIAVCLGSTQPREKEQFVPGGPFQMCLCVTLTSGLGYPLFC